MFLALFLAGIIFADTEKITNDIISTNESMENIELLVKSHFGERLIDSSVWDDSEGEKEGGRLKVIVRFKAMASKTLNAYRNNVKKDYIEILKGIFTITDVVTAVTLYAVVIAIDKYGNDRDVWVDSVKMFGTTGKRINWDRVEMLKFSQHNLWHRSMKDDLSRDLVHDFPDDVTFNDFIKRWELVKKE